MRYTEMGQLVGEILRAWENMALPDGVAKALRDYGLVDGPQLTDKAKTLLTDNAARLGADNLRQELSAAELLGLLPKVRRVEVVADGSYVVRLFIDGEWCRASLSCTEALTLSMAAIANLVMSRRGPDSMRSDSELESWL